MGRLLARPLGCLLKRSAICPAAALLAQALRGLGRNGWGGHLAGKGRSYLHRCFCLCGSRLCGAAACRGRHASPLQDPSARLERRVYAFRPLFSISVNGKNG